VQCNGKYSGINMSDCFLAVCIILANIDDAGNLQVIVSVCHGYMTESCNLYQKKKIYIYIYIWGNFFL
jgi:hypothetical protein